MSMQALIKSLGPPRSDARRKWPFVASLTFQGIPVDIEQRKGDTREGVDKDGTPWKVKMLAHYGEIRRTADTIGAKGMDGDRLDVYVGPDAASPLVVVVDQRIPETGEFDEQKVMLGFSTVADALACYRGQYTKPGFLGGHTTMTIDDLKARMADPSKAGVDITKALGLAEILASLAAGTSPEERVRARFERMLNRTDPVRAEAQRLLDATWSLAQRAQRYHWNVTGPTFSELHELFGAQYDEANAAVDEIAERMRAMGVRDVSPRPQGAAHPEPGESATAAAEQVRLLLVDHQNAARIANNLALAAEDAHDAATVDLAGRRALAHEKAAWMLSATMGPDAIAKAKRKQPRTPFIGPKGGKWANESHTRHWSKVDNHDPRAKADYYAKLRRTQAANAKGAIYTLTKWAGDHPERVEVAHHPDSGRVHLRFAGRAATHSSHDPADLLITPDAIIHRTAGVLAKRDGAPEPRLAPLTEPIAKGNLAAFLGALTGHEIPEFMAHALARNIAKAAHHKYLRRVLTGKTKPRYRYYYTVSGGKGLGHHDEIAVGAAFRMKDGGKDGHFEVKADHGDGHVTIRHDESGTEHKVHKDALAGMLRSEHAEAIQSAADKAKAAALKTLAEARESGSDKHVERAKAEAAKRGASEDETATPEERKAEPADSDDRTGPADARVTVSFKAGDGIVVSGTTRADADALRPIMKDHGMRWSPALGAWFKPQSRSWSAGDHRAKTVHNIAQAMSDAGIPTAGVRSRELVDAAAKEQHRQDRSGARAERLTESAQRSEAEANARHAAARAIGDRIPFGQPILVGHHSEGRARRDADRINNNMRAAVSAASDAEAARSAARAAERNAKAKTPAEMARKIKTLEAEHRSLVRSGRTDETATLKIRELDDAIRFWKGELDATGADADSVKAALSPGQIVVYRGMPAVIRRVGPKNATLRFLHAPELGDQSGAGILDIKTPTPSQHALITAKYERALASLASDGPRIAKAATLTALLEAAALRKALHIR